MVSKKKSFNIQFIQNKIQKKNKKKIMIKKNVNFCDQTLQAAAI